MDPPDDQWFRYDFGAGSPRVIRRHEAGEIVGRLRARRDTVKAEDLAERIAAHYGVQTELRFDASDIEVLDSTLRDLPKDDPLLSAGARALRSEVLSLPAGENGEDDLAGPPMPQR
jgi:hypothetical protein